MRAGTRGMQRQRYTGIYISRTPHLLPVALFTYTVCALLRCKYGGSYSSGPLPGPSHVPAREKGWREVGCEMNKDVPNMPNLNLIVQNGVAISPATT